MKSIRYIPFILLIMLTLIISTAIAETHDPNEVESLSSWDNARALTTTSNTPNGATRPVFAVAPNGDLIVVYLRQQSGVGTDTDPYYRRSSDDGSTWTSPAPIYLGATESRQVGVAFDNNNKAHAVWVEKGNQLWHGKENVWASNNSTNLFSALLIESPKIAVDSNNVLHLVWSQNDGVVPGIYYSRSTDGGSSWSTPENVSIDNGAAAESPALAIDSNNRPNVVWEEQVGGTEYRIRFSRRSGTGIWTQPRGISNIVAGITNAREPDIAISGNRIMVVFENRVSIGQQFLHYLECTANCTDNPNTSGQWRSQTVTVQAYGAKDTDPTFLGPKVTILGQCSLVIFSGITGNTSNNNEKVRLANSCNRFSSNPIIGAIEDSLGTNDRAIKPSVVVVNNWTMYIAYERKNLTRSDIYFVKSQPAVYLPTIIK